MDDCDVAEALADIAQEVGVAHPDMRITTQIEIEGTI